MSEAEQNENSENDSSSKLFLWAVAAILIGFGLVFGFQFFFIKKPSNQVSEYGGFRFEYYGGLWHTQWQLDGKVYNVRLHNNPLEVSDIPITGTGDTRFQQPNVYITFDPEGKNLSYVAVSAAEISLSLANAFGLTPVAACSENKTMPCKTRPIITCDNTNNSVIYLKNQKPTMVDFNGNCLLIQGKDAELLRATDRLLYSWYRIMR